MQSTQQGTRGESPEAARQVGGWLLWFATLGGIVAWSFHLVAAWAVVELGCYRDAEMILGLSLHGLVALITGVPLAVAAASLAAGVGFRTRNLGRSAEGRVDKVRLGRARFMAEIGIVLNTLAVLMIVFGGIAVWWCTPCT
jgi:hypothetical protein